MGDVSYALEQKGTLCADCTRCSAGERCLVRLDGQSRELDAADPGCCLEETVRQLILAVCCKSPWLLAR